ncbi:MAG TPA: alpha/beta fold hydrolase, partial [Polyangiales bacterium]|nr:alpha/beta fold hydrolase [Polyangiales bacterium]
MTLDATVQGSGPLCYLLPANGHHAADFAAVVPELARRLRTVALDWPATGKSPPLAAPAKTTLEQLTDVLEAEVLARSAEPGIFIGHSIGGYC